MGLSGSLKRKKVFEWAKLTTVIDILAVQETNLIEGFERLGRGGLLIFRN